MARSNNIIFKGLSGAIGKQLVSKQYPHREVVTKYPDMSNVKPSEQQRQKRATFKEAVAYARGILHDPVKKEAYSKKLEKGRSVYLEAIREYMVRNGEITFGR